MKSLIRTLEKVGLTIGTFLILANIVGLSTSLRNPAIYEDARSAAPNNIILSERQLYDTINMNSDNRKTYLETLTKAIRVGIADYWLDEDIDKYHLRIPFHENYLLYSASYIYPKYFLKYEFTDYRRAIERGVGMCSQHAVIEADVLKEKGISSSIIQLSGHVVLQAEADNRNDEWWVLDPDFGVTIPHNISEIEENPQLIESYYSEAGYDELTVAELVRIYGREGNVVNHGDGAMGYHRERWIVEQSSYVLIWAIPLFLSLPLAIRTGARLVGKSRTYN